jgi:amidase
VYQATEERSAWYQAVLRMFGEVDYLAVPSAQVFPFDAKLDWPRQIAGRPMDTYHRWMEIVIGGSLAGLPVMNVPAGFNAAGLPMGLQIMGPAQADMAVLQLSYAYEQATQWVQKRKPALLG